MCEHKDKKENPPKSCSIHICCFMSSSILSFCVLQLSLWSYFISANDVTFPLTTFFSLFNVGHVTHTSNLVTKEFSAEISVGDTFIPDLIYLRFFFLWVGSSCYFFSQQNNQNDSAAVFKRSVRSMLTFNREKKCI